VQHAAILLSPVFGLHYPDFREGGSASARVTALAQEVAARHLPGSDGRFAIHGHSAGGQFAVRYLLTHADRLTDAVISAPSEYAFPDPDVLWPHGAADAPQSADWVAAARRVRVSVLVGTRDVERRPAAPGHVDATRFERARAWATAMQRCAADNQSSSTVELRLVEGVDHDEADMTAAAQMALAERWR
jgi:alpha-beta hydrolase superfamily lysophospholipase